MPRPANSSAPGSTSHPPRRRCGSCSRTDAAGEGIDLQRQCHRLVNYDIPFNPNRLEQRIGRIDRYGQLHTPEVFHFAPRVTSDDALGQDAEMLARVAEKVAQIMHDLGSANEIIAPDIQRRLGGIDVAPHASPRRRRTRSPG